MLVLALLTLAFPASALGARGVVLSIDASHRVIEVVGAGHVVHSYSYRGRLPRLHAGSRVRVDRRGRVKVLSNKSSTVSFYGQVLSASARGLVLRLADGSQVAFSRRLLARRASRARRGLYRAHAAGTRAPSMAMLALLRPGVTVLVTETAGSRGYAVTIALPTH